MAFCKIFNVHADALNYKANRTKKHICAPLNLTELKQHHLVGLRIKHLNVNDDAIVVGGENETENCQVVYSSSKSLTCRYAMHKAYLGSKVGSMASSNSCKLVDALGSSTTGTTMQ